MEQRRFALKHLKDFGFGKIGLQGVIQEEVEDLVQLLSEAQNKDFKTGIFIPKLAIIMCIVLPLKIKYWK